MLEQDGVFIKDSGVCKGLGGLKPLDAALAPQAVIINLGQNDYGAPPHQPTTSQWVAAYTHFVRNITATYSSVRANDAGPPRFFLACGSGMRNAAGDPVLLLQNQ